MRAGCYVIRLGEISRNENPDVDIPTGSIGNLNWYSISDNYASIEFEPGNTRARSYYTMINYGDGYVFKLIPMKFLNKRGLEYVRNFVNRYIEENGIQNLTEEHVDFILSRL
jgi:hypothetical protein